MTFSRSCHADKPHDLSTPLIYDDNDDDDDDDDDDVIQVSSDHGSQPVTDQFVLKVVADKPQSGYGRGYTRTDYNGNEVVDGEAVISPVECPSVTPVTTATLVLDADADWLTGRERVRLIRDVADVFELPTSLFRLRAPPNDRPLMDVSSALAAGPGDLGAVRPRHPGLLVEWDVGCGNVRSELMASLEQLETASGNGAIKQAVARSVVGWYVTNNRRRAGGRRDPKRGVWPPRPTATPIVPTGVRPTERTDLPTATVSSVEPTVTTVWSPTPTVTVDSTTRHLTTTSSPSSPGKTVATTIRFDCNSTALRVFNDQRYDGALRLT